MDSDVIAADEKISAVHHVGFLREMRLSRGHRAGIVGAPRRLPPRWSEARVQTINFTQDMLTNAARLGGGSCTGHWQGVTAAGSCSRACRSMIRSLLGLRRALCERAASERLRASCPSDAQSRINF
jgi:hypothetical protein